MCEKRKKKSFQLAAEGEYLFVCSHKILKVYHKVDKKKNENRQKNCRNNNNNSRAFKKLVCFNSGTYIFHF